MSFFLNLERWYSPPTLGKMRTHAMDFNTDLLGANRSSAQPRRESCSQLPADRRRKPDGIGTGTRDRGRLEISKVLLWRAGTLAYHTLLSLSTRGCGSYCLTLLHFSTAGIADFLDLLCHQQHPGRVII